MAVGTACCIETAVDGTFSHLELASPAGLATLHPEGDGTLHGNVVDADGVHHVEGWPCPAGTVVLVARSVVAGAALRRAGVQPGALAIVLDPASGSLEARAVTPDDLIATDPDGRPLLLDGTTWAARALTPFVDCVWTTTATAMRL